VQDLLNKGNFKKIDEVFLSNSMDVFQQITKIQIEYKKLDTDTLESILNFKNSK
jgi:hypothetical protein